MDVSVALYVGEGGLFGELLCQLLGYSRLFKEILSVSSYSEPTEYRKSPEISYETSDRILKSSMFVWLSLPISSHIPLRSKPV